MKEVASILAVSALKLSTIKASSPSLSAMSVFSANGVRRNTGACGRKKSRGCGSKVKNRARSAEAARKRKRLVDHRAMAAMQPIEIADGDDRPRKLARQALADHEERRFGMSVRLVAATSAARR